MYLPSLANFIKIFYASIMKFQYIKTGMYKYIYIITIALFLSGFNCEIPKENTKVTNCLVEKYIDADGGIRELKKSNRRYCELTNATVLTMHEYKPRSETALSCICMG